MNNTNETKCSTSKDGIDVFDVLADNDSLQNDAIRRELLDFLAADDNPEGRQWIAEAFRVDEGIPEKFGLTEVCPIPSPARQEANLSSCHDPNRARTDEHRPACAVNLKFDM